ncbi:ATP-grasp domain-containing protein [Streptomyces sp. NPDC054854]
MRTDIVVQNVASFRIDPALLTRPHRRTILITSPVQQQKLSKRQRVDSFTEIVVQEDFSAEGLARCVNTVRSKLPASDRDLVSLLCHDEYSLAAVAEARRLCGLRGDQPHQLTAFVDKVAMKRALSGAGIRMPAHREWSSRDYLNDTERYTAGLAAELGWPMFVKPVSESGSVGARKITDSAAFHAWATQTGDNRYEVDEFLQGELFHVDSAVHDGHIVHAEVNAYLHPCFDYVDGRVCASYTVPREAPGRDELLEFNKRVLDALVDKPRNGAFHHEIYRNLEGELVFLEIAARAPAAMVPATSRITWGIDIEEAHFRLQRGELPPSSLGEGPHSAWVYFPKAAGRITALEQAELASDHHWQWNVEVGQSTQAPQDIRDFAAAVLLWNDDFAALQRDLHTLDGHRAIFTS